MYLKSGVVYVNFGGTEEVRFIAARGSNVLVANLKLPGGTKQFKRDYFEREFTEKTFLAPQMPENIEIKKTDPKAKSQAHNPYVR